MEARPLYPDSHNAALLTTGGKDDPLLPKLIEAINRAVDIEITVAFIRISGLKLLFGALADAVERKVPLKVLSSDYLDVTDPQALRELMLLKERGADIRIYQCDGQQSFHMKSYIFIHTEHDEWIKGCAYVGSSNISKAALTSGHEWNLQLVCKGSPDDHYVRQFNHIRHEFHGIFNHPLVNPLSHPWIDQYLKRRRKTKLVPVDEAIEPAETPSPSDIQIEALQALQQSRFNGYQRGMVVLATGLGKTWLAAFDVQQCKARKVLFVAHREEILLQAQKTFVHILPDARSGFYNGRQRNTDSDLLFASIQTLGRTEHLRLFDKGHFDYIVVDEFHHADAKTYRNLLSHFTPAFLLGLTATPERTDQADILSLCDNNLVYERNLIDGINTRLLAPFHYYGINDQFVDYDEIPWRSGKFDLKALEDALASRQRAQHILKHWQEKKQQRTLAFCVSKNHAQFMATSFQKAGYQSAAVFSGSEIQRHEALTQLEQGRLDILFSVDLFNEGTDLPAIDTVLMLRPTESKILFLQQLGRGLRRHEDKTHLVVIDFIGNHKSFLTKPVALQGSHSIRQLKKQLGDNTLTLPDGCFVNYDPEVIAFLDRMARLEKLSIENEYQALKQLKGRRPTAGEFFHYLNEINIPFKQVRQQHTSWFQLLAGQHDLSSTEASVLAEHSDFLLNTVESTAMSRCFKMILLKALLELDGFSQPPTLDDLTTSSWHLLKRHPDLFSKDLPESKRHLTADSKAWHTYWQGNPIKFYTNKASDPFKIEDHRFICHSQVKPAHLATFSDMVYELVELRLEQYSLR